MKQKTATEPLHVGFIDEVPHIGGGQMFADQFRQSLTPQSGITLSYLLAPGPAAVWQLVKRRPQVMILNLYSPKTAWWAALCKLHRIPICLFSAGIWKLEYQAQHPTHNWASQIRLLKLIVGQRLLFDWADQIILVSEYQRQLMCQYYPATQPKLHVIHGAAAQALSKLTRRQKWAARTRLGFARQQRIFLCLARMEKRKGVHLAVEAFARTQLADAILVIVFATGTFNDDGYLLEVLRLIDRHHLGSRVHLCTGVVAARFAFYQAADVFIMPSTQLETLGLTVTEALAHGCVVTGFTTSAITEILPPERRQFLHSSLTARALTRSIKTLGQLPDQQLWQLQQEFWQLHQRFNWQFAQKQFRDVIIQMPKK